MHRSCCAFLVLFACAGKADPQISAWGLQIDPIVPAGTDPFQPDSELTLRLMDADGHEDLPLGASAGLTWTADDVPALQSTRLGLLLTDPNASIDPLDYADVRAWGQTGPLDVSEGDSSVPVLVAAFGQLGGLGALPRQSVAPALAVLPDGDVLLFGGTDSVLGAGVTSAGWRQVLRLSRSDEDLEFEEVGDMPALPNSDAERVGATATVVDTADGPQVLVAGGRYKFTPANKSSQQAFRWDPVTDEVVWDESLGDDRGRSQHVAIKVGSGDVLLAGGWDATGRAESFTFDWYRAGAEEFARGGEVDGIGPIGFAWADLGDDGVLVCGGGASAPGGDPGLLLPSDKCQRIGLDGQPRSVADLGTSTLHPASSLRTWAAAATLHDGRVLLCGGTGDALPAGETRPAVADAWLYDPDNREWELVGSLQHARAMHRVVALGDGRALVLGGVDEAFGAAPTAVGASVIEVEVFDPVTGSFTDLGPGPVDLGALPAVAEAPGHGLFVVAGVVGNGGGDAYGIVGLGP